MKIVFIGSGNLATNLSLALNNSGQNIVQVYSKTLEHAQYLADKLCCRATNNINDVVTDADIYIFSVKDDVLEELVGKLSSKLKDPGFKIFLHTAGSVPMSIFENSLSPLGGEGWGERLYGVFYPMQTFSKDRKLDFNEIPIFIEGNNEVALNKIEELAKGISQKVVTCDSEKRKFLHLAAVFACNMTNHCYRLCEQIVNEQGLDFELFLPLIRETAKKVETMSPKDAQTGPMVRYDKTIMDKQLALINNPFAKELYTLMAKSIHEDSTPQKTYPQQ